MERLDLRLVEYFIAVAEELHFGRAAERLHISQPSLSQQIRRLETQMGIALLERTSRSVRLTDAGAAFLREGRKTMNQAQRTIEAARAAGAARLAVGFYGSAADALLPEVLRRFAERWPACVVSVRELLLGSVDDLLLGKIDVAFTRLSPGQTALEVEVLAREPRLVALAASHPLADLATVGFGDLREQSFIINPAVEDNAPPPRWMAEQQRHGLPGRVAAEATSIQEILNLVAAGRGVCLVPAVVAEHHPRAGVRYVPVHDAEPAVISLAWRPGELDDSVEAFIATARDVSARNPSVTEARG
jgi:DNA-binding transcriptional LysR family regulator